jgi:murein DD-endopeptidase MepM/ murein hydrolase activator NlpD
MKESFRHRLAITWIKLILGIISLSCFPSKAEPFRLMLPTDNREIFGDPSKFYMYTTRNFEGINSKPWEGGQYGFVRDQVRTQIGIVFKRLHEGMDIRPVRRDKTGVPLDEVRVISDGTVVYVNLVSSASSYGKYVVVRHDWLEGAFYSLYAHLASASVTGGQKVAAGHVLGRLGFTGAGIDLERAHVHVELNFLLSERFKTWYGNHYPSPNHHGIYNGFNLTGMDVARLFLDRRKNPGLTMREFLNGEEPYFKVKAPGKKVPSLLARHPWLGQNMQGVKSARSWEFTFAQTGVPLAISPDTSDLKFPVVTWVKTVNTNHSYMTMGRLAGSGNTATLSSEGSRYLQLIAESF